MLGEFNDSGLARDGEESGVGGGGKEVDAGDELARANRATPLLSDPDPQEVRTFHILDPNRGPHLALINAEQQIDPAKPIEKPRETVHGVEEGCVKVAGLCEFGVPGDEEQVVVGACAIGNKVGHGGSFPGIYTSAQIP